MKSNPLCVTLSPPQGQPIQKSYRDWNTGWPQDSWEVTENGIYYQAAYVRALSKFCNGAACGSSVIEKPSVGNANPVLWVDIHSGKVELHLGEPTGGRVWVRFFNVAGRLVKNMSFAKVDNSLIIVDMREIPGAGLFLVAVSGDRGTATRIRLVKP